MPANFYPGQTDYLRKLNDLALAKDVADIPRNAAAAAASAAAAGQAATSASADAVKASAQAASAGAAFASFDARYLGAKALAPTLDNAGGALLAGATYWDTVLNGGCLRVFQAGAWVTITTNAASQVVSTPVGGIVAKNVQAALAELDSKKAARATTLAGYGITDTSVIKADIGLGSVDNTSDVSKPVSILQQAALNLKAPLDSADLTGTPLSTKPEKFNNSRRIATVDFVNNAGLHYQVGQGIGLAAGANAFTKEQLGHWLQFNSPNSTLAVGPSTYEYMGSSFTVRAPFGGTVNFSAPGVVLANSANLTTTYVMRPGEVTTFTSNGVSGWYVTADSIAPSVLDATYAAINGDAAQDFKVASINGSFIGGMQNRIINGDMRINQRGVPNSGTYLIGYGLDRWNYDALVSGKVAYGPNFYNVATRAPGFPNYLGLGAQGAYNAAAGEAYLLQQVIEGNHLADLQYGTAAAKTCTLSAWVCSNIAGMHSGAFYNILANKSYVFSFPVPVANTWTKIVVSIPGDTVSAMNTNNMQGLHLRFNLGSGANFLRAVTGTWIAGNITGVTGAVNMLGNNGNFLITGVQFEAGQATSFSRRSMAEEMQLCLRYYCNSFAEGADVTALAADALALLGSAGESVDSLENNGRHTIKFPVPMRASPTINMRGYVTAPTTWACQGTDAQGGITGFQGTIAEAANKRMKLRSTIAARQYNIQGNWEAIAEI
ncbi:hypothetical protein [Janthinobacterium sp. SUN033]|uniref:hypothetical protein n=1 Tax=Janthinobacterium sp. SUN033 TaxID=3002439 RepID=UPI0025B1BF48|nr:hypothetical protein [Janthinobacterium sp. SUN033]MDN2675606.1 hypothetical protein [Janthinobacterium sp. SUN033]